MTAVIISKYTGLFSQLSGESPPQIVVSVLDLVPQIVSDVKTIEGENSVTQKDMVIQIVNAGLTAAYNALGTKLNLTKDAWVAQIETYVLELVDYELNNLLVASSNGLEVNQSSYLVRTWNWMCSCTK